MIVRATRAILSLLAGASFLASAVFLVLILGTSVCGVEFFSPQVDWTSRLSLLALPVLPLFLGCLILVARRQLRNDGLDGR